jgi:predicted TIM-barrel fold metal-dependent hydrolase
LEKMAVISIDGHVTGSVDQFREYVPRKHLDSFEDWAKMLEAVGIETLGNLRPEFDAAMQWDSQRRLRDLEEVGVVAEVLFPNGVPFQVNAFVDVGEVDAELKRQSMEVYNRWLADFCAETPGRRAGQALVSFDDVDQAVKDVYWAKEHKLGGIMMPALVPGAKFFFDPALDPVWAACQEVGLPVSQHGGSGLQVYNPIGYAAMMTIALESAFFSGRSLWQLVYGGVFERFPDLQVVWVETEVDWIGRMIQKMDARLMMGDDWAGFARHLNRERPFSGLASDYWIRNMHAGVSPFSTIQLPIAQIIGDAGGAPGTPFCLGTDRSMFGVDYPHFESIYPEPKTKQAVGDLLGAPEATDEAARRILYENAAVVYGFDLQFLEPDIERVGFTREDVLGLPVS